MVNWLLEWSIWCQRDDISHGVKLHDCSRQACSPNKYLTGVCTELAAAAGIIKTSQQLLLWLILPINLLPLCKLLDDYRDCFCCIVAV